MLISFLRDKYPIAQWTEKSTNRTCITFGWDAFRRQQDALNINAGSLPPQWRDRVEDSSEVISYLSRGRPAATVGPWSVSDHTRAIYASLARNYDCSDAVIHGYYKDDTVDFYQLVLVHDRNLPNLYFTAPRKFRESILAGRQPIRWLEYYRDRDRMRASASEEKRRAREVFDRGEGVASISHIQRSVTDGVTAIDVDLVERRFSGLVFSLHDGRIDSETRRQFGEDTFQVKDVYAWARAFIREALEYFKRLPMGHKLVGAFAYVGQVRYGDGKAVVQVDLNREDLPRTPLLQKTRLRMVGTTIQRDSNAKFEDFLEAVRADAFRKEKRYALQSEWRLIVGGVLADHEGCGYLDSPAVGAKEFMAKNLSPTAIELIVPTDDREDGGNG